jgi:hypothetical protein
MVGWSRRNSLPSSMSSWTRKALCKISSEAAEATALSASPPKARQVARHSAGRTPLPTRPRYEAMGS